MAEKFEFNAPADTAREAEVRAAANVGPDALVGIWTACDGETRGLVRVVIGSSHGGTTVQAFGACQPTPCDWGVVDGLSYAADVSSSDAIAFTAMYKFSFKSVVVTGVLDSGSLRVETFNHFTDGSGRSDYYSKGYFCRRRG